MKKIIAAICFMACFSMPASAGILSRGTVYISRIVATQTGGSFVYFPAGTFGGTVTKSVWGVNYDVVHLPNTESYALALAAKSQSKPIRLVVINNSAGSWNLDWTATVAAEVNYIDFE